MSSPRRTQAPAVDYTATVVRPRWAELPPGVQRAVGTAAGSSVVDAADPPGSGFTGGFAAVVRLEDGRSVFAKAGSAANPHIPPAYAQEALVLQALPEGAPAARFVGAGRLAPGEVDEHEWRIVVAEAVTGRIPQPWTEQDVDVVHDACVRCVEVMTPGPADLDMPSLAVRHGADPDVLACFPRLASGDLRLTRGQPAWVMDHVDELAAITGDAARHLDGQTACHGDLRADNLLVGPAGAVFVDWNWLMTGAGWTDFVGILPLARADGVDVDAWLTRSPLTRDVDPAAVDAWLAVIAAYMLGNADEPVWPGGPPLVREHQRRYASTFLDWLGDRRGWS